MSSYVYVEGGGSGPDSKELNIRCREGFRRLLEKCGFKEQRRMPRLFACGGRAIVYEDFKTAHLNRANNYVAMWLDSEEPLADLEAAWAHLKVRDNWSQPAEAVDDQVLFMTTCMETLLVTDRTTLKQHFGNDLQESALPPLNDLENRHRREIQDSLFHATRDCKNTYVKGKGSFEVLGKLNPTILEGHLPSFVRVQRILNAKL